MGAQGLEFQLVDVRFTEGLDTKTQPKVRLPGKWDQLNNLTLSDDNTPQRRDGFSALASAANGNGLATRDNELLVVNGSTASSIATATSPAAAIAVAGQIGNVGVQARSIVASTSSHVHPDCASGRGYTCYAWVDKDAVGSTTGLSVLVVDEASGTHVLPVTQLIAAVLIRSVRVVFSVDTFFIFYVSGVQLLGRTVRISSPSSLGAQTVLINGLRNNESVLDACDLSSGGNIALATVVYPWADGTTSVRAIQVFRFGAGTIPVVLTGPVNVFTEAELGNGFISGLACVAFSNSNPATDRVGFFTLSIAGSAKSGTSGRVYDAFLSPTTATVLLDATVSPTSGNAHITGAPLGTTMRLFYDQAATFMANPGVRPLRTVTVTSVLGIQTGPSTLINSAAFRVNAAEAAGPQGPWIAGKAFVSGSSVFLPCAVVEIYSTTFSNTVTNNQQGCFFLLDGTTGAVLAKALYGTYGAAPSVTFVGDNPCSVATVGTGIYALFSPQITETTFSSGNQIQAIGLTRLTLTPNTTVPPIGVQLGQAALLSSGVLSSYDGSVFVEHGFNLFPEGVSAVGGGAGTGSCTDGTHQVIVIYEWFDAAGQRHQSAPSGAVSITLATGANSGSITLQIPTLLLTQKTGVQLVPYMTLADGLTFHRVTRRAGVFSQLLNDTTTHVLSFKIDDSDANIASNELLYTQPNQAGTALPNISPPPSSAVAAHQNRLFLDATDSPNVYQYSQQLIPGVGLQFSEVLTGMLDVNSGGIVGFADLDEKMIILCQRKIYAIFGTGPTSTGGFNNYSDPVEVPSDVGCIEARSILRMPMGIIFKSPKGWYLLGRDLTVKYIGDGVKAFDANSVSSAVLLEDRQECRFSSLTGTHLVYSYQSGAWSTFTSSLDGSPYPISDAIWWPLLDRYVHVTATMGLNQDTPGVFVDAPGGVGSFGIATTGRTGWLRLSSIDGFQRVRWMYLTATANSQPDTVQFNIAVDFDDSYGGVAPGSYNFDVDLGTIPFAAGASIDLRHKLRRQKCKSVAFTFTESPNSSDIPLRGMQALALQIGIKRGTNKLPAAQSVG